MSTPTNPNNPADGKHVVIQNGQRVTGPVSADEAQKEAARRNKLTEQTGQQVPEGQRARVAQNIFG
jgi:hypothetical protein